MMSLPLQLIEDNKLPNPPIGALLERTKAKKALQVRLSVPIFRLFPMFSMSAAFNVLTLTTTSAGGRVEGKEGIPFLLQNVR